MRLKCIAAISFPKERNVSYKSLTDTLMLVYISVSSKASYAEPDQ